MMQQTACGRQSLRHMKAGRLIHDKVYGRDHRGAYRGSKDVYGMGGRNSNIHTGAAGKGAYSSFYACMDIAVYTDTGYSAGQ